MLTKDSYAAIAILFASVYLLQGFANVTVDITAPFEFAVASFHVPADLYVVTMAAAKKPATIHIC